LQTSVVIVKPGGTGRPRFAISARLAPLPPKRLRISAEPSAFPAPKRYTNFSAPAISFLRSLAVPAVPTVCVIIPRRDREKNELGWQRNSNAYSFTPRGRNQRGPQTKNSGLRARPEFASDKITLSKDKQSRRKHRPNSSAYSPS